MVFSDLFFIFVFLPAFALLYLLAAWIDKTWRQGRMGLRNGVLIVFSLLFYAWGEPVYVALMLGTVLVNYLCGLGIGHGGRYRKTWLIVGIIADIGVLGTFKYLGFFTGSLAGWGVPVPVSNIALPIGISFYIFQSLTYLVDVYRGDSPVQRNFANLLLYIAMFPQLIAGPIVRYGTVAEEINHRTVSGDDFMAGAYRFFIGLAKKVIIANVMGEVASGLLDGDLATLTTAGAWVGLLAFTLQIYFDFSGYSDMAIGMGRCVGFHFNENFNHPYTARSVTDFWRRWHMSLGGFFRDYVYIPMGGNRRHQAVNILTVWFLTGMWHGAAVNFIFWGLYFGLVLVIEKYTLLRWHIPRVVMHCYALAVIVIGWGLFYYDDLGRMGRFYTALFGHGAPDDGIAVRSAIFDNFYLWIMAILLCLPLRQRLEDWLETRRLGWTLAAARGVFSVLLLAVSVALLVGATNNAFIYTRF